MKVYDNLQSSYEDLLVGIYEQGHPSKVSFLETSELKHISFKIKDPLNRYGFLDLQTLYLCLSHCIFSLSGTKDAFLVENYDKEQRLFVKDKEYVNVYKDKFVRLEECVEILKKDKFSFNTIVHFLNDEVPRCQIYYQFVHNDGKLDMIVNFLAVDIIQWYLKDLFVCSVLHELMASWSDLEIGELIFYTSSVHYCNYSLEYVKSLIHQIKTKKNKESNKENISTQRQFSLERNDWNAMFLLAKDIIEIIYKNNENIQRIINRIDSLTIPETLKDWIKVLYSEKVIMSKDVSDLYVLIETIKNPLIKDEVVRLLRRGNIGEHHVNENNLMYAVRYKRKDKGNVSPR